MNAHNKQHDSASPVVKQNLTTAAAQEAVVWQWRCPRADTDWSDCDKSLYDELRKAIGGEAGEMNGLRYQVRALYAAPVTAAPADHLHAHLLHMLGAKDHEDAGRIIGELHAATMRTPAAPGIDVGVPGATLTIDGETFTVDEVRLVLAGALADAKRLDFLIRTYSHLRMRNGAWVVAVGGETPAPGEGYPTACAAIDAAMQTQAGDAEVQP